MSSRIRADAAGPGEDAHRSPQEPAERGNAVAGSDSPEPEEASQRPADGSADGMEGEEAHQRAPDAPANDALPEPANEDGAERRGELSPELKKRLDRLTFEGHQARRERDEAMARLAAVQRQQQAQQQPSPDQQAEERAYQRLQQERLQQDFDRDCNTLWQKGVDEYGDEMAEAKRGLDAVGWGNRPDALAALTSLPDGHRIYRELGADLDNAARILSLPPMRMAVELARLSGRDASNPLNVSRETNRDQSEDRRSRAPQPLRPVGGNSARGERPLGEVSMAEFIRRRDRDERGSRIRR